MNTAPVYLDSSAILKLIFEEPETSELDRFLKQWPVRVSSALARVEVMRIAARVEDRAAEREAHRVLRAMHLLRVDEARAVVAEESDAVAVIRRLPVVGVESRGRCGTGRADCDRGCNCQAP